MLTRTGAYLFEQRQAKRLTRGQLAAAVGYTNLAKGAGAASPCPNICRGNKPSRSPERDRWNDN